MAAKLRLFKKKPDPQEWQKLRKHWAVKELLEGVRSKVCCEAPLKNIVIRLDLFGNFPESFIQLDPSILPVIDAAIKLEEEYVLNRVDRRVRRLKRMKEEMKVERKEEWQEPLAKALIKELHSALDTLGEFGKNFTVFYYNVLINESLPLQVKNPQNPFNPYGLLYTQKTVYDHLLDNYVNEAVDEYERIKRGKREKMMQKIKEKLNKVWQIVKEKMKPAIAMLEPLFFLVEITTPVWGIYLLAKLFQFLYNSTSIPEVLKVFIFAGSLFSLFIGSLYLPADAVCRHDPCECKRC